MELKRRPLPLPPSLSPSLIRRDVVPEEEEEEEEVERIRRGRRGLRSPSFRVGI